MSAFGVSHEDENWRLEQMVRVVKSYQDGKVLLSPFDATRPDLRVLDSAASNGFWLSQLRETLQHPDSSTLIGVDIEDRFPSPPRPGITLQLGDLTKPWPAEWQGSFDLVHQSLALTIAGSRQRETVDGLLGLVKPGGWVELLEPDFSTPTPGDGTAQRQFFDMVNELRVLRGAPLHFPDDLEGFLKDAGFVDVKSVLLPTGMGASIPDPALQEENVKACIVAGRSIVGADKFIPGQLKCISREDLQTWLDRWEKELRNQGGSAPTRVVFGRKPGA